MDFLKVMVLCLSAVFLCVFFSQYKKEYSAVIAVAAGCIVLIPLFKSLAAPLNSLLNILTQFVSEAGRDFGCGSIAAKAELAGKISIFLICLPLLSELFSVITELI